MSTTPEKVREVIGHYIEAWNTNNKALLLSLFAEDAQWTDPVGGPTFVGHEGVAGFWDFAHQGNDRELEAEPRQIIACANEGILHFTMKVRIPAENKGLDLQVTDHFVLNEDGLIATARAFWDEACVNCPEGMELFVPDIT